MSTVSDAPADETPEQLKARLLRCPKLKKAVCKVARSQGVRRDEEEDVYQETMLRMAAATLPPNEVEARKYVHGIAKNVAIDHLRKRAQEGPTRSLESLSEKAHPVRERMEQRTYLLSVLEQGRKTFGVKWDLWERSKIHKETSDEIAAAAGLTPGHVRHEVSVMSRWFDGAWGKRTGTIGGVMGLLLAVGLGWSMTHRTVSESDVATFTGGRADTRIVGMDAAALRARGMRACDDGAWGACEEDLTAAAALDAEGESMEVLQKRLEAQAKQMHFDADHQRGPEKPDKPGR